jgi:hypothetical protein
VAKRFAKTTGSVEFDTARDITQLRPALLMRHEQAAVKTFGLPYGTCANRAPRILFQCGTRGAAAFTA